MKVGSLVFATLSGACMILRPGGRVVKDPENWIPNCFDQFGRGEGVGIVVPSPIDVTELTADVRWPGDGGRYWEDVSGLLAIDPVTGVLVKPTGCDHSVLSGEKVWTGQE